MPSSEEVAAGLAQLSQHSARDARYADQPHRMVELPGNLVRDKGLYRVEQDALFRFDRALPALEDGADDRQRALHQLRGGVVILAGRGAGRLLGASQHIGNGFHCVL